MLEALLKMLRRPNLFYSASISRTSPLKPYGVEAFRHQWQPKVGQELGTAANKIDEDLYEVILKITINVQLGDKTAFLVEVQQAGLFMVTNIEGPNWPTC